MFRFCPNCSTTANSSNTRPFHCTSCDFTYYHNVAASVAAIIVVGNQILLTERAKSPGQGMLDLPGGFVDPKESLEQSLIREIQEELSISIPSQSLSYFCSVPNIYQYQD